MAIYKNEKLCKTDNHWLCSKDSSRTDCNYDHALEILQGYRYGRKDLIENAHMTKLLNLIQWVQLDR